MKRILFGSILLISVLLIGDTKIDEEQPILIGVIDLEDKLDWELDTILEDPNYLYLLENDIFVCGEEFSLETKSLVDNSLSKIYEKDTE